MTEANVILATFHVRAERSYISAFSDTPLEGICSSTFQTYHAQALQLPTSYKHTVIAMVNMHKSCRIGRESFKRSKLAEQKETGSPPSRGKKKAAEMLVPGTFCQKKDG